MCVEESWRLELRNQFILPGLCVYWLVLCITVLQLSSSSIFQKSTQCQRGKSPHLKFRDVRHECTGSSSKLNSVCVEGCDCNPGEKLTFVFCSAPAGKGIWLHLTSGPVAYNPPAAHQEDHPGWWRGSEMKEPWADKCSMEGQIHHACFHTHRHTNKQTNKQAETGLIVYSIWRGGSADDFEYPTAHCYTVRVLSLLSLQAYLNLVRM